MKKKIIGLLVVAALFSAAGPLCAVHRARADKMRKVVSDEQKKLNGMLFKAFFSLNKKKSLQKALDAGANINARLNKDEVSGRVFLDLVNLKKIKSNNTVLHIAVSMRRLDLVKKLLTVPNINPSRRNAAGNTPLHMAARKLYTLKIVKALLAKQNNILLKNKDGKTAADVAKGLRVKKYLEEVMARTSASL